MNTQNKQKNVSIIGLGWLGLPLALSLQKLGFNVIGSKSQPEGVNNVKKLGIDAIELNLPIIQTNGLFENTSWFDLLFNQCDVAIITLPAARDTVLLTAYQQAVRQLKDHIISYNVPNIIFTSSTSVYGSQAGVITEQSKLKPETSSAKILVELEAELAQAFGNKLTILRLAGLAGADRHPGRYFARYQQNSQSTTSKIQGKQPVNLVHQYDVIQAIHKIIEGYTNSELTGSITDSMIYNLSASEHPLKADYYTFAANQFGLKAPKFLMDDLTPTRVIDGSLITHILPFVYHFQNPYDFSYQI